jgi:hypothetical protein
MKENKYINEHKMAHVVSSLIVFLEKYGYMEKNKQLRTDALVELMSNFIADGYENVLNNDTLTNALGTIFTAYPDKIIAITEVLNSKEVSNE